MVKLKVGSAVICNVVLLCTPVQMDPGEQRLGPGLWI